MSKKQILPYRKNKNSKKIQVRQMFDSISARYDIINRIISGGLDLKWRKNVVKIVKQKRPKRILDVATGTGDLAIALYETLASEIIGIDISEQMLEIGKKKVEKKPMAKKYKNGKLGMPKELTILLIILMQLQSHLELEILKISIKDFWKFTEFSNQEANWLFWKHLYLKGFPLNFLYHLYTLYFLPLIGSFFSKDKSAYKYLICPQSWKSF